MSQPTDRTAASSEPPAASPRLGARIITTPAPPQPRSPQPDGAGRSRAAAWHAVSTLRSLATSPSSSGRIGELLRPLRDSAPVRFSRRFPEVLLGAVSACVFSWRVAVPSAWWDEAITRGVISRPTEGILDLTGHVDLVHLAYYLLVHGLLGAGASITAIRMISVAAAVATTVLLVRLGRELDSTRVGVTAASLWIAAPFVSRYAQEARPYALVTLTATAATLALVRVCRRPWLPRRWVLYAALLMLVGIFNVLGLLLVLPHLVYVIGYGSRAVARRWLLAVAATSVLLAPLVILASGQREQVSWLPRPDLGELTGFFTIQFAAGLLPVALVVLAVAGLRHGTHRPALLLGLAWAVLPPVALWLISQQHPLYNWRYLLFALPGSVLVVASLATLLRPALVVAMVAVFVVAGWHMQQVYRYPASGHAEDVRGAAEVIRAGARPGDAVLFLPASRRVIEIGYPADFRSVDDIALARDATASATLWGVESTPAEIAAALQSRWRVWLVSGPLRYRETMSPSDLEKAQLLGRGYHVVSTKIKMRYEVQLYVRGPAPVTHQASPAR